MSKYLIVVIVPICCIVSFFGACQPEITAELIVLTEDVLYVSGERVRLSGRIYENNGFPISMHGFELSENENFDQPLVVNLGETNTKGQFIGQFENLKISTHYWYRAVCVINEKKLVGISKEIKTLMASVNSFEPEIGYPGELIKLSGANFSNSTRIYFGSKEVDIISNELESFLSVLAPNQIESPMVEITIVNGNESSSFDKKFEYIYGKWNMGDDFFVGNRFFESLFMNTGNDFILGLGKSYDATQLNQLIYKYNFSSATWTEIPFEGAVTTYPFQNSMGYFGAGAKSWSFETGPEMVDEFWQYMNSEFINLGKLPFQLYKAISFYHNNAVYVLGGYDRFNKSNYDVYRYNTSSKVWDVVSQITAGTNSTLPYFFKDGIGYFLTSGGELYNYNFDSRIESFITYFPSTTKKENGFCVLIADKVYMGLFSNDKRIWEYNISDNSWKFKTEFPGYVLDKTAGYFVDGDKIKVIRMNRDTGGSSMKIWDFEPEKYN